MAGAALDATATAGGLGIVSAVSGVGSVALDGGSCLAHLGINASCVAAALGAAGIVMSGPETAVTLGLRTEPPFQEFLALSIGGFYAGAVAGLIDAGADVYNHLTSGGSCGR